MSTLKVIGLVLIILGLLGLVFGGFSYTKEKHEAKLGPIAIGVEEKERVNVPMWAGVGAIVAGAAILAFGNKKGG